jgi:hypothetical protein
MRKRPMAVAWSLNCSRGRQMDLKRRVFVRTVAIVTITHALMMSPDIRGSNVILMVDWADRSPFGTNAL